jgi:hypothetical protein
LVGEFGPQLGDLAFCLYSPIQFAAQRQKLLQIRNCGMGIAMKAMEQAALQVGIGPFWFKFGSTS